MTVFSFNNLRGTCLCLGIDCWLGCLINRCDWLSVNMPQEKRYRHCALKDVKTEISFLKACDFKVSLEPEPHLCSVAWELKTWRLFLLGTILGMSMNTFLDYEKKWSLGKRFIGGQICFNEFLITQLLKTMTQWTNRMYVPVLKKKTCYQCKSLILSVLLLAGWKTKTGEGISLTVVRWWGSKTL